MTTIRCDGDRKASNFLSENLKEVRFELEKTREPRSPAWGMGELIYF